MSEADNSDFAAFLVLRHKAAEAFVNGDGAAFQKMLSTRQGSFFSPLGTNFFSIEQTASQYVRAAAFLKKGEYRFETLASGVSGDMAWMMGIQWGELTGQVPDRIAQLNLRVTEVYQRENGCWKLVHRHADTLKSPE